MIEAESRDYRKPPHNEQAEQAILGIVMVQNRALSAVQFLPAEAFYVPVHQRIYDACERLISEGKDANPITLRALFEDDEALAKVGGWGYLARLVNVIAVASLNAVTSYAETVYDLWRRRLLIDLSEDTVEAAYDYQTTSREVASIAATSLDGIMNDRRQGETREIGAVMMAALNYNDRITKGDVKILPTGIQPLDAVLHGGMRPEWLVILAGATSIGKTSCAISIIVSMAKAGRRGLFFSQEQSASDENPEIGIKVLSHLSGVPTRDMLRAAPYETMQVLAKWAEINNSLPLVIDDSPAVTASYVARKARSTIRKYGSLDFIAIDYLQIMNHSMERGETTATAIGKTTHALKSLAKELGVPIICLSQLSRGVDNRTDKRPILSDLRESGSIEQDADVVLFVYRRFYYMQRETKDAGTEEATQHAFDMDMARDKAEIIVAKHRMGEASRLEVMFHGPTQTFHDGGYDHAINAESRLDYHANEALPF